MWDHSSGSSRDLDIIDDLTKGFSKNPFAEQLAGKLERAEQYTNNKIRKNQV